jgi:hypothetical protein
MISRKWVNTEPDDGAVPALLQRMEIALPADSLESLWIFPTRRAGSVESTVVVAACRDLEPDRRRVYTAHYTVTRDKRGRASVAERIVEHATAPVEALSRVVDGVVRRLGDEAAEPPRHESIDGEVERFDDLIRSLGGEPVSRVPAEQGLADEEGAPADDDPTHPESAGAESG